MDNKMIHLDQYYQGYLLLLCLSLKKTHHLCYCRISIRTRGRYCPSSTASTASSVEASPFEWWSWTMCCREPWRCTTSTTWRDPRTNAAPHAKSVPSPHPHSKTWTSRTRMRAWSLTRTHIVPWWKPCRGTVGYVYIRMLHPLATMCCIQ